MNIVEMIEMAKKSEYGMCWFSEKGPINISKEGVMTPAFTKMPQSYQPERSKREDSCKHEWSKYNSNVCAWCGYEMRCSEHCGNTVREVQ